MKKTPSIRNIYALFSNSISTFVLYNMYKYIRAVYLIIYMLSAKMLFLYKI